jgi:hypothetical protein
MSEPPSPTACGATDPVSASCAGGCSIPTVATGVGDPDGLAHVTVHVCPDGLGETLGDALTLGEALCDGLGHCTGHVGGGTHATGHVGGSVGGGGVGGPTEQRQSDGLGEAGTDGLGLVLGHGSPDTSVRVRMDIPGSFTRVRRVMWRNAERSHGTGRSPAAVPHAQRPGFLGCRPFATPWFPVVGSLSTGCIYEEEGARSAVAPVRGPVRSVRQRSRYGDRRPVAGRNGSGPPVG